MSRPIYKLYYFAVRARAEPARLVFAAAGVHFENIRIPNADEWSKHKYTFQSYTDGVSLPQDGFLQLFDQKQRFELYGCSYRIVKFPVSVLVELPVLEVDVKQLAQSRTIVRYLANEFGFAGKNKWEVAEADQLTEAVEDLIIPSVKISYEDDGPIKDKDLRTLKEETAPNILQAFEARLANSSSGFLVGGGLTYADLCFMNLLDFMEGILSKPDEDAKGIISKYPNAQKHRQKIASLPKIDAWIKNRPKDDF